MPATRAGWWIPGGEFAAGQAKVAVPVPLEACERSAVWCADSCARVVVRSWTWCCRSAARLVVGLAKPCAAPATNCCSDVRRQVVPDVSDR